MLAMVETLGQGFSIISLVCDVCVHVLTLEGVEDTTRLIVADHKEVPIQAHWHITTKYYKIMWCQPYNPHKETIPAYRSHTLDCRDLSQFGAPRFEHGVGNVDLLYQDSELVCADFHEVSERVLVATVRKNYYVDDHGHFI